LRTNSISILDVQQWNDTFAREFDIDAYYTRASVLVRWVTQRRMRVIKKLVKAEPDNRILEVGCGGGHILRMFAENQLVGVDVSGEMIRKSQRNLRDYDVTLHRGELAELRFPRDSFDRIICSEVLEHVVEPESLIAEMARILAPHGRMVVTVPNDTWIDTIKAIVRRSGLRYIPPFRNISWGGDQYHLHSWTQQRIRDELSRHLHIETLSTIPFRAVPLHFALACRVK